MRHQHCLGCLSQRDTFTGYDIEEHKLIEQPHRVITINPTHNTKIIRTPHREAYRAKQVGG